MGLFCIYGRLGCMWENIDFTVFMTFVLVVYTFGFISFLFVPSFDLLAIIQIICAITGILINISTILVVRNERSKITNG